MQPIELSPMEYDVDHEHWRPHQYETVEWALDTGGTMLVEAPTGFGKTGFAKAIASQYDKSIALTRTKNLQETNYANGYGFFPLYGRNNYPCQLDSMATVAECGFGNEMMACPAYSRCDYIVARETAKAAKYTTLNYRYWFLVHHKWPQPDFKICDEGHQLPDLVLEWAGCTITEEHREKYNLPMFPIIMGGTTTRSAFGNDGPSNEERAEEFLGKCITGVEKLLAMQQLQADTDDRAKKEARRTELFLNKLKATHEALTIAPKDWYLKSGPRALDDDWGFVARPLTAKHHFKHYFCSQNDLLIMSATMGDISTFAAELGLVDYSARHVPSLYTPEQMPVYALDVPRMGQKAGPLEKDKQAEEIAKAVRKCPGTWHGIIHTNSQYQARELCERLARLGLQDKIWSPRPGTSTNETVRQWERQRYNGERYKIGKLIVTWNLQEGYDGTEEKINIVAKIPYPYLGDPYEQARQRHNGSMYFQRAAWGAEQMQGRNRRGREEDYDTPQEMRGLNAFADASWNWVKKYFSNHFRQCITTM